MAQAIRVLFADDHRVLCEGLASLARSSGIEVVGITGDRDELIELAQAGRAHVAVVDISMPGASIPEVLENFRRQRLPTRVLVLTASGQPRQAEELLSAGVAGYVIKEHAFDQVLEAIRAVASGKSFVSPQISGMLLSHRSVFAKDALTDRQLEVLRLVAVGDTNARIARKLGLHVKTVDNHRYHIRRKLGVHSSAEMIRVAIERGLI